MAKKGEEEYEYVQEEVEVSDDELQDGADRIGKSSGEKKVKNKLTIADLEKGDRNKSKALQEDNARGAAAPLTLQFPDGKSHKLTVPMGQTVEYVKTAIEKRFNVDYQKITLKLGDKDLLDLFCLSDYPAITSKGPNVVKVIY